VHGGLTHFVEHVSVEVRYFGAPACPWSSAAEPALRKIIFDFDGELDFARPMGGLARHCGSANRDSEAGVGANPDCFADLMSHWLNVAGRTGTPFDPRLPPPRAPSSRSTP
jgi:protein-disulfide isomerase-like protein with CxxC motif